MISFYSNARGDEIKVKEVRSKYSKIPLLRSLENKTTSLLRPAFASPKWNIFLVFYMAPDKRGYLQNNFLISPQVPQQGASNEYHNMFVVKK